MKRFNANKVKPSCYLTPSSEKDKAALRRINGIKQRWACDLDAKEYNEAARVKRAMARKPAPLREDFKPSRLRGNSGTRLSPEIRAIIQSRMVARGEFFAALKS